MVQNASSEAKDRSWHAGFLFVSLDSISLESFLFFSSGHWPTGLTSSQPASLNLFITIFRHCLFSFAVFLSSSPDFYAFLPCAVEESPHHLGSSALSGFPVFSFHLSASRASSQVRIRPAVKKEGLGHLRVLCADNRLKTFEIWSIRDRGRISEKSAYHPMLIYPFIQCSWILTSLYK